MALPATDTFTTGTDQALQTYSAAWTINDGAWNVDAAGDVVYSLDDTFSVAHWNTDAFNANQYAQAVYTENGVKSGPATRVHASASTCYGFYGGAAASYLFKLVAGTFSQLGSNGVAFADAATYRIEANGTTLTTKKNSVATGIGDQTDASIASGSGGISAYGNYAILDNWEAGDLAAAGCPKMQVHLARMRGAA